MSYWFCSLPPGNMQRRAMLENGEFILPAERLGDLSRAQGTDQIAGWLRQLNPAAPPEDVAARAEHFWRLAHEIMPEDTLVVRSPTDDFYMIGEITGRYQRQSRETGLSHLLPVEWHHMEVASGLLPALSGSVTGAKYLMEITDEKALFELKSYVPGVRKGNASLFRWIAIITLIFELFYFWPSA